MASVQYGTIVTSLKGNIGGQTFQDGNIAKVLRNKGYRKGKNSVQRQAVTARLVGQTTRWRALSDSNRTAWDSATGDWPFTDKFGNTYYGSGYQMFAACNIALNSIGQSVVDTPPATVVFEPCVPTLGDFETGVELNFGIDQITTASQIVQCYASAGMSPGKSGDNVAYKYITSFNSSIADTKQDTTVYPSLFGWPPVGSLVMFKLVVRPISFPRAQQEIIQRIIVT